MQKTIVLTVALAGVAAGSPYVVSRASNAPSLWETKRRQRADKTRSIISRKDEQE